MRVLVTGAYGLIGSAVLARLHSDGHDLLAAGRSIAEAARRMPYARWMAADFNTLTEADAWLPLLQGVDAVVNCVGVLEQGGRDHIRLTHIAGTVAVFNACVKAGVRRVVHVSAIGAASDGKTEFARTKAEADAHLATLDLDWTILRPALVLSPMAYGGTAMLRAMAAFPLFVPGMTRVSRVQVVDVGDVAETVAVCLRPTAPPEACRTIWELAHPQTHSLAELVSALRGWLGFSERPIVTVPYIVAVLLAAWPVTFAGWFGWRSPTRVTAFLQLAAGVIGDPGRWSQATGIRPKSLAEILSRRPAGVQERWFARLYLMKPFAIFGLAAFWISTGLVAMGPGHTSAVAQFAATGFSQKTAELVVLLGAAFDVTLGTLLLFRRFARRVLITMFAATLGYLLAGTILAPQLWTDPLGPLVKIVPMLVATLLTLAIVDDR